MGDAPPEKEKKLSDLEECLSSLDNALLPMPPPRALPAQLADHVIKIWTILNSRLTQEQATAWMDSLRWGAHVHGRCSHAALLGMGLADEQGCPQRAMQAMSSREALFTPDHRAQRIDEGRWDGRPPAAIRPAPSAVELRAAPQQQD